MSHFFFFFLGGRGGIAPTVFVYFNAFDRNTTATTGLIYFFSVEYYCTIFVYTSSVQNIMSYVVGRMENGIVTLPRGGLRIGVATLVKQSTLSVPPH